MKKLCDFVKANWRAVTWTIFYFLVVWGVLYGLFGFNIFSRLHLAHLAHLHLHGFGGLVFGVLVLAAVPLYVATTALTIRNKAVPIKIPCPKCFMPVPPPAAPAAPAPVVTERETLPILPHNVPQELREVFMRARKNVGARQMSVFNKQPMMGVATNVSPHQFNDAAPESETKFAPMFETVVGPEIKSDVHDTAAGLPIPEDFDIAETDYSEVPVFSDIKFDDDDVAADDDANANDDASQSGQGELQALLTDSGIDFEVKGDLVIVNGHAIASHMDDDFWVADELDWFAAGKQKPSPIAELVKVKDEFRPILYLGATNIMDFKQLSKNWRDAGIGVITDYDELLKLITD